MEIRRFRPHPEFIQVFPKWILAFRYGVGGEVQMPCFFTYLKKEVVIWDINLPLY